MGCDKPLGLLHRLELPHASFTHPGCFVRLLHPIILILFSAMNYIRHQLSMSDWVAPQLVCHNFPGLAAMPAQ